MVSYYSATSPLRIGKSEGEVLVTRMHECSSSAKVRYKNA